MVFKAHPHWGMHQNSVLFFCQISFPCVDRAHCFPFHPVVGMRVVALLNHGNSAAVNTHGQVVVAVSVFGCLGCLSGSEMAKSRDDSL